MSKKITGPGCMATLTGATCAAPPGRPAAGFACVPSS